MPQGDNLQHRFAQTLYFIDAQGFGSLSRYQLDKTLGERTMLRWSSDLRFEEELSGAFWSSEPSNSYRVLIKPPICSTGAYTDKPAPVLYKATIWVFQVTQEYCTTLAVHGNRTGAQLDKNCACA